MSRFRRIGLCLFAAAVTAGLPRIPHAADTEDALIKGVSEFLLDRANDNYVYIFQRQLESNEPLKKYLPATLRVAKAGDLRSLLTNRDLWKRALKADLERGRLLKIVRDDLESLIEKKLCPKNGPSELRQPCEDAKAALDRATETKTEARVERATPEVRDRAGPMMTAFTTSAQIQLARSVLVDLKNDLEQVGAVACEEGAYTSCVIQILALLDAFARADYAFNCFLMGNWCWNNQRDKRVREENDDFDDFKRFALFFAQMADAAQTNDPERVKVLLKSVTIPPVSFGIKREPHRTRVLITAYLGAAWARDKTESTYDRTFVITAPIGFEISQARGSGNSLSLLVSPVDFGYPLSLKMQDSEATVRASDIVVPAAYVLWGPKNYPFAGGLGYARVRSPDTPDKREGRWLLFLGFDLPLFKLY